MKHLDSIALIIPSFRCGGAERVVAWLANSLVERGRHVFLVTLDGLESPPFFPLDERVVRSSFRLVGVGPVAFLANLRRFRGFIAERQVRLVVSFVTGANVAASLGLRDLGVPVVVAERDHPLFHRPGLMLTLLRPLAYRMARRVVIQSDSFMTLFPRSVQSRTVTIPNPVFPVGERCDRDDSRKIVCAAGRLVEKKGFSDLIAEFAMIAPLFPAWDLVIYGAGPEEPRLREQIESLALRERIALAGEVSDVPDRLRRVDIFVLASRYEGFPNALSEAMAAGCAVIARDCPGAIHDLIVSGVNGVIASGRLADSMTAVMSDPTLREKLGRGAREAAVRFAPERILGRWEGLMETVMPVRAPRGNS
jgi:GalNAc-alpha-(1->4)-GalNAc-alpha-(1->3)-diNAcBac-PP-undecaprenol alpha-1,4-N-acetyl-D-galactosaminyltransferase